ncbi:MAG: UDP-glucose/GDP-mannose dehydrogenase family protein [Bacteroidota bacterium]|nr:UDP-glucose/GDP-mannose dehydrogenase family protein [Bacteroidota bacterium]MDP4228840.1 UDP-glucose/GDP-mannose dehydrogenase family protein [Bacteroidota bacterium]MDP4235128.1 UDP-glucose/GDP-mannose dehydrogenase family protein [Bacteroidota bacterium]
MNVAIIGTGYVGLVTGAGFAETGNNVICMDIVQEKIDALKNGIIPIYEPGLEEIVRFNMQEGRLVFTTNLQEAIKEAAVIFLALPTPQGEDGAADLSRVMLVAKQIAQSITEPKVVVNKSTVPVGTAEKVKAIFKNETKISVEVVSNPEFLKEGAAVQDFLKPDRIVIGSSSSSAIEVMQELYEPFVRTGNPIYIMDEKSAEITKYAANAMLALRISFMNEIANICDRVGADVDSVRRGIGSDGRIGQQFLFPGVGFGGSCFPKDVSAIIKTAAENGYEFKTLKAVQEVNYQQKKVLVEKILAHYNGKIAGKTFAVWGLSFKPKTDDIRDAPSVEVIRALLEHGAKVQASDPVAIPGMMRVLPESESLQYRRKNMKALDGADALIIVTEWNEFRNPDFNMLAASLKDKVVFDGRNIYDPEKIREHGLTYYGIGRR